MSLKTCAKKIGIAKHHLDEIRKLKKEYMDDDRMEATQAEIAAAQEYLSSLFDDRAELAKKIEAKGGVVPKRASVAPPAENIVASPAARTSTSAPSQDGGAITAFGDTSLDLRRNRDKAPSLKVELSDSDIAAMPLSKIWPKEEIDNIEDIAIAAFATAVRAEIPSKPRKSYAVKSWVEKVKTLRGLVVDYMEKDPARVMDEMRRVRGLRDLAAKVDVLAQIDRDDWPRIDSISMYPDAFTYDSDGKQVSSPFSGATIDGRYHRFAGKAAVADFLPDVRELLGKKPGESAATKMKFSVRGRVGYYYIHKDGDPQYRKLKEFTDSKEALDYVRSNNADLVKAWEAVKERDNVKKSDIRSAENKPRTGDDYRKGKDVTVQEFHNTFGLRHVDWGNWVSGKGGERQGFLNEAYDAFMDLASITGLPPRAIGLDGKLIVTFGKRGSGWASAHFESGSQIINLTKTKGAGSLAHEWFHAADNYFQRQRGDTGIGREKNYITYSPETYYQDSKGFRIPAKDFEEAVAAKSAGRYNRLRVNDPSDWTKIEGVRPAVEEKFVELVDVLNKSPMKGRAETIDAGKGGDGYWSRIIERAARSFESYVISKMEKRGYHNDFLANVVDIKDFVRNPDRYPYLLENEMQPVADAFDNLFATIQTKETDSGVAMFSRLKSQQGTKSGLTTEKLRSAIADAAKALGAEFDVTAVQSAADLPQSIRSEPEFDTSVKGIYSRGRIYLVADNIANVRDAQVVLAHELVGHKGVLEGITADEWADIKTMIADLINGKNTLAVSIMQEVNRRYGEQSEEVAYKEFLAIAAERRELRSGFKDLWARLKASLVRMLKAVGLKGPFSETELELILGNSERYLKSRSEAGYAGGAMASRADDAMYADITLAWLKNNGHQSVIQPDGQLKLYRPQGTTSELMYPTKLAARRAGGEPVEVLVSADQVQPSGRALVPRGASALASQDRLFVDTTLQFVKDQGYGSSITPEGNITVFHGTSKSNVRSIEKTKSFKGFPFFALDRATAERFARQAKGTPEVMELVVDPDIVVPTGGYLTSRISGLKEVGGVYTASDELLASREAPARMYSRAGVNQSRRNFLGMTAAAIAAGGVGIKATGDSTTLGMATAINQTDTLKTLAADIVSMLPKQDAGADVMSYTDIAAILTKISEIGPSSLRPLASKIAALMPLEGTLIVEVDGESDVNAHGLVRSEAGVELLLFTKDGRHGLTYGTFLHEALHIAVLARYQSLNVGIIDSNYEKVGFERPKAMDALKRFSGVFFEFRESINTMDKASRDALLSEVNIDEAFNNPDEFFVRALTDPVLQEYLAGQKYLGKTLLERFIDWIKFDLFGLKRSGIEASWLDAALLASDELVDAMINDEGNMEFARAVRNKIAGRERFYSRVEREAPPSEFAEENRRIREEDNTIWNRVKQEAKRQLTPAGLLPDSVFRAKIARDSKLQVVEFEVAHLIGELERAIRKDYGVRAGELSEADQDVLSQALGGRIPQNVPAATKEALIAMRAHIDKQSQQYLQILQEQVDGMASSLDPGERELLRAFIEAGRVEPDSASAPDKAKATKRRNEILDAAKEQAREVWGDGKKMQESLSTVAALAEKLSLMEVIAANDGKYVHRSYQAFDDPNWFKKLPDKVLDDARAYLMRRIMEDGTSREEAVRQARVIIEDIVKEGTAYDSMEAFIKESKLGAKDLSVLKQRKQIAPEIRALLGEYKDPRINYAKSATKMGRLIWNQRFLDRVREVGMGVFLFDENTRPPNTTKLAADGSEIYSPLNGLYAPREIVQAFKDALGKEQMANWYRNIVQLNGAVKFGKTILSPTTAMRNWQSAMFFSLANGHFDMTQMAKSVSGLREYFTHSGSGKKLAYLKKLKDLGVVYDTPYAAEMMKLLEDSQVERFVTGKEANMQVRQALDYAKKFYGYGDDFWKIIGFENEKNNLMKYAGMNEQAAEIEAAERIRNTYPTYSMVGRGIQSLRRFPLVGTFVSFPAEIIRTSFNMLKYIQKDLQNPATKPMAYKKIAGLALVSGFAYALQEASKQMFDLDDDDEEAVRMQAAPWQQNSNLVFTGRDDSGRLRYFDISFLDPYNYFKRPINAMLRDQPWQDEAVSAASDMVSPFLGTDILAGTIFEILANKKDTGGEIYKETDSVDRQLFDITNHLRKSVQPGIVSNLERTWSALKGEVSGTGQKYNLQDEGMAWLGWRATTLDPKVALYYRSFDFGDAKTDATRTLNQVLSNPNEVDVADIEDAYGLAVKMRVQAYDDMTKMVGAARKSGMTDDEILQTLQGSGISKADIRALMEGFVPPWMPTVQSEKSATRRAEAILGPAKAAEIRKRFQEARKIAVEANK